VGWLLTSMECLLIVSVDFGGIGSNNGQTVVCVAGLTRTCIGLSDHVNVCGLADGEELDH
jgi:hypothetical protein